MDLRIDRTLADARICNVDPNAGDLGVSGSKLVLPGDPERSTLLLRMRAQDTQRMPPLATRVVDSAGVLAIESWIRNVRCTPRSTVGLPLGAHCLSSGRPCASVNLPVRIMIRSMRVQIPPPPQVSSCTMPVPVLPT
jgi:hypothetical protein